MSLVLFPGWNKPTPEVVPGVLVTNPEHSQASQDLEKPLDLLWERCARTTHRQPSAINREPHYFKTRFATASKTPSKSKVNAEHRISLRLVQTRK